VEAACARFGQLANFLREVFADARQLEELFLVHPRHRIGPCGNGVRGGTVRPNLEEVRAFDFEQVGDFGEDLCDGVVIHA
jgi:hypothetical protein